MPHRDVSKASRQRLAELIQEATVDAYGEHEELVGLATMIEDKVELPFDAKVIGEPVQIVGFEQPRSGRSIQAVCRRGRRKYKIDLSSIDWTTSHPKGFEWIEAYLEWLTGFGGR